MLLPTVNDASAEKGFKISNASRHLSTVGATHTAHRPLPRQTTATPADARLIHNLHIGKHAITRVQPRKVETHSVHVCGCIEPRCSN